MRILTVTGISTAGGNSLYHFIDLLLGSNSHLAPASAFDDFIHWTAHIISMMFASVFSWTNRAASTRCLLTASEDLYTLVMLTLIKT